MADIRSLIVLAAVLVVAPLTTAASCRPQPEMTKACTVVFSGIGVRAGQVVETVTAICDVPPQEHYMRAAIEFAVGGTWVELGRAAAVSVIPDAEGYPHEVTAPCDEGIWRTRVEVHGIGPTGIPFTFTDVSPEQTLSLVECAA